MTKPVTVHMPDDWTGQQALNVYELLHELAEGIWDHYETLIIDHIDVQAQARNSPQPDPPDFDDALPFRTDRGGPTPATAPPAALLPWLDLSSAQINSLLPGLLHLPTQFHLVIQCGNIMPTNRELVWEISSEVK